MAERSKELIQVGYYLSKYGPSDPPTRLKTTKWYEAYRFFYDNLNGGRTVLEFEHSLKNSRDTFDGYFKETQREGWKDEKGNPIGLTGLSLEVFNEFEQKNEGEIWSIIINFLVNDFKPVKQIFDDLIGEDNSNGDFNSKTEGGLKVRVSKSIERNSRLRQIALEIHGYKCQVCDFDFELKYGEWGKKFAEVHHIVPISKFKDKKRITNPATDLAVLCSNCHSMVHRKKDITLSLDELRSKLKN